MHLGLNLPVVDPAVGPAELRDLAVAAEERGFHELYLGEHVVLFDEQATSYLGDADRPVPFPPDTNLPEPLTALAHLAAVTTRIRLATGVVVLPQRNPVYAAKQAATLDWLSGGRLDLTVGIGWSRLEFEATRTPWARRGARSDEYVALLRELWRDGPTQFEGEFYELARCYQYPKPVQRPGPPVWFGGTSDAALRRVANHGDGWYVFDHDPARLRNRLGLLDALRAEQGRDDELSIVLGVDRLAPRSAGEVDAFAEVGVHQLVFSLAAATRDEHLRRLDELAQLVAA